MKKISFKTKTTIWITFLVAAVCIISIVGITLISGNLTENKIRQNLISAIESNADEIEYQNGILEVESDFSYYTDGVYCDVYSEKAELLASKTPDSIADTSEIKSGEIREISKNENSYYVYDFKVDFTRLEYEIDVFSGKIIKYEANYASAQTPKEIDYTVTYFDNGISTEDAVNIAMKHAGVERKNCKIIAAELPGYESRQVFKIDFISSKPLYESVILRGTISAESVESSFGTLGKAFIFILPLFTLLAALGAYIISKRTIEPIEEISRSAHKISDGNDLSKRIEIKSTSNEIATLAQTFNEMLSRLQGSFENEKQFTSDASHELRTPLAVIKAECEYALSVNTDNEEKSEALQSILEQSDKMNSLVNSLLALARTEQGKQRYKLEKTDLSSLIDEICREFKTDKNITLNSEIESGIYFDTEATLIKQLLNNLLSNAVRYGKQDGFINVSLYNQNNNITLSVEDNGIGLKEDEIPKIWNRFFRADAARSNSDGFGLGLSIVKQIAELHGGEVSIKSVYGKGSTFFITFKKF